MKYCFFKDQITPVEDVRWPLGELGLTRGYGLFEFFRVYQAQPLYLDDHLDRLWTSLRAMRLELTLSRQALAQGIYDLVAANNQPGESGVRIVITGGISPDLSQPLLVATQETFTNPPEDLYTNGCVLLLDEYQREWPEVKTTNYLRPVYLTKEKAAVGAIDLLYHWKGQVSECARSAFCLIKDGVLYSADQGVLKSVTRKNLMKLYPGEIRLSTLTTDQVLDADEVFMASTIKRLLPVRHISGIDRNWEVGPQTADLMKKLQQRDEEEMGNT